MCRPFHGMITSTYRQVDTFPQHLGAHHLDGALSYLTTDKILSHSQDALHRGLAGALLPPSGHKIHLGATCGPFINRVRDGLGHGTARLLASIVQTIVYSWTFPDDEILQACWALYQDLFGPGETFQIVPDLGSTRLAMHSVEACMCRHQAVEA